jgi:hypothetical protein
MHEKFSKIIYSLKLFIYINIKIIFYYNFIEKMSIRDKIENQGEIITSKQQESNIIERGRDKNNQKD